MNGTSAADRSENARRAAQASWRRVADRRLELAPARMGFLRRCMFEVDPTGALPYEQRLAAAKKRRAEFMREIRPS
jgi:hypothetical protein